MTAYGKPYTVRGWVDEVVTTVRVAVGDFPPPGYTAVVRGTVPGPVILVPTAALTPVDTTPAEPEPGVYEIDGIIAVCVERGEWRIPSREQPGPEGWAIYRFLWPTVWEKLGGPDVPIVRLAPEPAAVELPWRGRDVSVVISRGGIICSGQTGRWLDMTPDEAEARGHAFLTAARAAREATS